jgi:sortase A
VTLLELRPPKAAPAPATPGGRSPSPDATAIEDAVTRLAEAARAPGPDGRAWSPELLCRWLAAQPDPERALGQLVLLAAGVGTLAPAPAPAVSVPPSPAPAPSHPAPGRIGAGVAAPRPVTGPEGLDPARLRRARVCLWVRNLGCLLLLFLAYQWWGTGFEQHRSQARLRASFQPAMSRGTPAAEGTAPAAAAPNAAPAGPPLPGSAVARLQIPAIGLDQFVVEGTATDDLKQGPGHYAGSPLPGRHGNAAIAGHRTTYGAPFNRLDDLKPGDAVVATTAAGRFTYTVSDKLTVVPSQTSVLDDYGDDRLTLTTCTPKFSASHRLVVVATLQGPPAAGPPVPATPAPAVAPADQEASGGGIAGSVAAPAFDLAALPASALSGLALIALALLYRPVRRRWPPLAATAVLAPMWIGGLLMLFEALNRFLPSNV